jgi:hypothetical protein
VISFSDTPISPALAVKFPNKVSGHTPHQPLIPVEIAASLVEFGFVFCANRILLGLRRVFSVSYPLTGFFH